MLNTKEEHPWAVAHSLQSQCDYILHSLKCGERIIVPPQIWQMVFAHISSEMQKVKDATKEDYNATV